MKNESLIEKDCHYEIQGSLFLAMGSLEKEVTDVIMELMDQHVDDLPIKEDHVQTVACVIDTGATCYYSLAYINTGRSVVLFLDIDEISVDEYLDHRLENRIFN